MPKNPHSNYVYVISAENGYKKIGSSQLVFERFAGMRTNSPLELELEYVCECTGALAIERAAQMTLAKYHVHREWFNAPIDKTIEAVRAALRASNQFPRITAPRSQANIGRKLIHIARIMETTK